MKNLGLVVMCAVLATTASAQSLSGTLSGSVVDSTSAVIPGATVNLINETSGEERQTNTNANGDFFFPALVPGPYTIRVESSGFQSFELRGNVVLAGGRLAVGAIRMEVGNVVESVSVTSRGMGVQTEATNTAAVLDSTQMAMISLRGRDPVTMLRLLPGVEQGRTSDMLGGSFGSEVPRFMGKSNNTIYVDGVNGGDGGGGAMFSAAVNMDAIAEFSVKLSGYTAEHGRSGGPQIHIITKRGGQEYHGTGYWYKRHEMFNSNNFFNNLNRLARPLYRFSNLGGNIGGPVPLKIPLFNPGGGKMFFFYSVDDTQVKRPNPIRRFTMPTDVERQGDFSQSRNNAGALIVVQDPLTGRPFPGNIVPISRRDPHGQAILNIFALPNIQAPGYNFIVQHAATNHPRRQHLFRVDFRPTEKDAISFKGSTWYTRQAGFESPGSNAADARWGLVDARYDFTTDMGALNYTRIVSPRVVNEFMIGIFYSTELGPPTDRAALERVQRHTRGLTGLPQFAPQNNPHNVIPMAQFSGLQHAGFNTARIHFDGRWPLDGFDTQFTGSNNVTYTRGSHTFKVGAWWEKAAARQARAGNFSGEFQFAHNVNDPGSTGYAFANAFIGHFQNYTESLGRPPSPNRVQHNIAWFAQDTWKVNRRLTLDIGLRMYRWGRELQQGGEASVFSLERFDPTWGGKPPILFQPTLTPQGRRALNPVTGQILPVTYIGAIVPGTGFSCSGWVSARNPCVYNGIVIQENGNYVRGGRGFVDPVGILFDPRFGLAWDPFGDGKMAIRASWGVFHQATSGALYQGGPAFRPESEVLFSEIREFITATPLTTPANVTGPYRKWKQQLNYQYTFGIQRDIGRQTVLDVAYVGNHYRHLPLNWNHNLLPQGIRFRPSSIDPTSAAGAPLPDNLLRPFIGFRDINQLGTGGTDRYDSLQVQLNRRFTGRFELASAYTYANALRKGWYQQLQFVNRDRNDLVQTHILSISYVIDVPRGSRLVPGPVGRAVLDNWQVSGFTTLSSGVPMNVVLATTDGFDFSGGGESCGVVQTGPAILPRGERSFDRWFNTSVFQRPRGRGDLGNNCQNYKFRGPGINNHDISFFKNFPLRGDRGYVVQLRWELYNAFNHTQFQSVNNTARFNPQGQQVNAQFGRVSVARDERRMQISVRVNF